MSLAERLLTTGSNVSLMFQCVLDFHLVHALPTVSSPLPPHFSCQANRAPQRVQWLLNIFFDDPINGKNGAFKDARYIVCHTGSVLNTTGAIDNLRLVSWF